MPTQKFVLPAGPKFEPFYVSLQVAAQSDATYMPGYSWHVNKIVDFWSAWTPPKKLFYPPSLSLSPFMYRCRSLRKVMLRTCLDTADTSTKEFPTATSTTPATVQPSQATSYSAEKAIYDNGDIFGNKTTDNTVYRQTIAFTDQIPIPIPEDIPGLPIHRPGEYSPSYDRRSTRG